MGWKILLPQEITDEDEQLLVDAGYTLIRGRSFETEDVLADVKECRLDAIVVRITPIVRKVVETSPNLKVVIRYGVGLDVLDVKACHDNGIQTLYTPVASSASIAETATPLMLECSRNVIGLRKTWVRDCCKAKLKTRETIVDDKIVGIIRCGNIGSRLTVRAPGMETSVLAYDPYRKADEFPEGIEMVRDLDWIFKESDYVSLHMPNTSITRDMVNKEHPEMMKSTAFLINTVRGGYAVEQDLYEACKSKIIAGAELDAIQKEPVDPVSPLLTLDNIITYPYIGGNAMETTHKASYFAAIEAQEVYKGREPTWPINDIDYVTVSTYTDTKKPNKKSSGMFGL